MKSLATSWLQIYKSIAKWKATMWPHGSMLTAHIGSRIITVVQVKKLRLLSDMTK
jgi:hypothetical protein